MEEKTNNELFQLIEETFKKSTIKDLDDFYIKKIKNVTKWTCYSDYCFDDKNKPNDVVTFTLVPYVDDFNDLSNFIQRIAKVDIKKTRTISEEFTEFLKKYPLINFSFILNNRKKIFGKDHNSVKKSLKNTFEIIKKQYIEWSKKQPEQREYYKKIIKKIDCVLELIKNDKKIKQIIGMLLVTFLGAYVSSKILRKLNNIELFGWFSDRDAINEVCNNFSIELFQYFLHGLNDGKNFKFVASPAGSNDNAFYEELVRIPDYIAGAISDYNMKDNLISKNKFDEVLTNYMADNEHNNFVFNIFVEEDKLSSNRITLHKNKK